MTFVTGPKKYSPLQLAVRIPLPTHAIFRGSCDKSHCGLKWTCASVPHTRLARRFRSMGRGSHARGGLGGHLCVFRRVLPPV